MRIALLFNAALLIAALAGCAGKPAPATAPARPASAAAAGGAAASAAAPAHATLASEQKRLAALFRDTPAVFVMEADGSLRAAVPLRYCFERGAVAIKPPLAAVLDRLAKSQRDEPTRWRIAAPPDAGASPPNLVRDRSASVRDHLVAQGIAASRITLAGTAQVPGVEVFVSEAAPQ